TRLDADASRQLFLQQVKRHADLRKRSGGDASANHVVDDTPADTPQSDQDSTLEVFLRVVRRMSAKGFEHLCMRLLREAGFERVQVTGRSNDGGVDGAGVLQINELVSFNVVFQCKKWEQAVPPKEIRDLRGAMDGRAEKGILITTSSFSTQARAEADRPGAAPVELVDGLKLFEMFKKYELGLKPRTVYDVDPAFFEQFG
ncbi:MAG: restriction endonuclease, partial [Rubrivivax sp.]